MTQIALDAPSKVLLALELRAFHEFSAFLGAWPLLSLAPRGDGHPVLVLPGLLTSDDATRPLRSFLSSKGYAVHGWELGRNCGLRDGVENKLSLLVDSLHQKSGRAISLVGWSLGGIYARELAKLHPHKVRSVITLGSPFAGSAKSTNAWKLYELASGASIDARPDGAFGRDLAAPPPVPTTAIYSKSDGICAWQGCVEKTAALCESIEVDSSHCGMGAHPAVAYAVAERLSQGEGEWRPFHREGWRSLLYPDPSR